MLAVSLGYEKVVASVVEMEHRWASQKAGIVAERMAFWKVLC